MSYTETIIYTRSADPKFHWSNEGLPWPSTITELVATTALLKKHNGDWDAYYSTDRSTYTNVITFPSKEDYDSFHAEPWVVEKKYLIDLWTSLTGVTATSTYS